MKLKPHRIRREAHAREPRPLQRILALLDVLLGRAAKLGSIRFRHLAQREERVALLQTIPGVGPITASAIVATVGTGRQFGNGGEFAAWLGLTPLNRSSGGKERLGRISKMGDPYIRRLLVIGMMSRMRQIIQNPGRYDPWFVGILARKPGKVAAVAMANKTARMVWAVLTRNEPYRLRSI